MWAAIEGFTTIAIVVFVGYLLARLKVVAETAQRMLADIAFFVGQPTLVAVAVSNADLQLIFGWHSLVFALACLSCGLGFALFLKLRWRADRAEATIGYLATSYVNAGNLGIPLMAFILGDAAWAAPAMLMQVLILQPSAVAVLESSANGAGRSLLRSFVTHPVVLGGLTGLTLNLVSWQPPTIIWAPVQLLADLGIPAMLLAFGMSLHWSALPSPKLLGGRILAAIITKSFVVPGVALGLALLFGLTGQALQATVILAALPTAQVVFVHAMRYRTAVSLVQATTLWSTLLSIPVILATASFLD